MILSDFPTVEALINARAWLVTQQTQRIEISIGGHEQSRSFVESIEPAIRLELRHRIADLDERLRDLGVTID